MKPLSDNVLILPAEKLAKVGTLFLAVSAQEDDNTGTVVSIGPGKLAKDGINIVAMNVVVGDTVMFTQNSGVAVTHEGKRHLLVSEVNILAVI